MGRNLLWRLAVLACLAPGFVRGANVWDHHAEVVFFGSLIGWTTPATDQRIGHAVDVWQGESGGTTGPTFLSAIPPWYPDKNAAAPEKTETGGYDRLPTYRFHR